MKNYVQFVSLVLLVLAVAAAAGQDVPVPSGPRRITLQEAVQLALKHNHVVHIAQLQVEEKQHAKDVARSSYFPTLRNDSSVVNVTDSQFIEIPAGAFGAPANTPVPSRSLILNQGGTTFGSSGTQLTQPLTEFLKFKPENDIARADLNASRNKARGTENDVALKVHQLYYKVLIAQIHRSADQARIRASEELQKERVQQVKFGSVLEQELIESRAQYLQAKQDLLSTDLLLSDITLQLNDALGLPLETQLALDPSTSEVAAACELQQCIAAALGSHPEILEAQQQVQKATAGVRLAKAEYVPNIEAFARHSYQENVPFLARNFGSFGIHFGYDLFDGGRRHSLLAERESQLKQAKENLARVSDEVELRVRTSYNKLERTKEMMGVSRELLAVRSEASRTSVQQLAKGAVLRSQADSAVAQELDAKTLLLQSQLEYVQANDEMAHATGRRPE